MNHYTKTISILLFSGSIIMQSCRSKTPWNPYLSAKEKPSDKQRKEEQKQMKTGTKAYNKQMERNRAEIQGNINRSFSMQKKHRKITKNKRFKREKKASWRF